MNPESWLATTAALLFAGCIALIWRHTQRAGDEFFHFDRKHHVGRVRLIASVALAAATLAIGFLQWSHAGLRAEHALLQQRLVDARFDLAETRSALYARARNEPVATAAGSEPTAATQSVNVERAVVRSAPGGASLYVLPLGVRVTVDGRPVRVGGRDWKRIFDNQGRRGWIAAELLS